MDFLLPGKIDQGATPTLHRNHQKQKALTWKISTATKQGQIFNKENLEQR
jgi:hypothetical protein